MTTRHGVPTSTSRPVRRSCRPQPSKLLSHTRLLQRLNVFLMLKYAYHPSSIRQMPQSALNIPYRNLGGQDTVPRRREGCELTFDLTCFLPFFSLVSYGVILRQRAGRHNLLQSTDEGMRLGRNLGMTKTTPSTASRGGGLGNICGITVFISCCIFVVFTIVGGQGKVRGYDRWEDIEWAKEAHAAYI